MAVSKSLQAVLNSRKVSTSIRDIDLENTHLVGCLSETADKQWRMAVYARFPYNGTSLYYLCRNCDRRHVWVVNDKDRNWKDKS